ncbi:HAAS signaling domain-containing protein [Blastococcus sp. SYSU D00922]
MSTTVTRQAEDYLAAVEHELADLPAEDRSALLEDLALHLDAVTAEDDDRPVEVRLGPPAQYAADLRAAAGLPPRGGSAPRGDGPGDRLAAVRSAVAPAAREVRRLLVELRPAWWVLRGYLVVLVPCLLGSDRLEDVPVPAPLHSHLLGVLLVVAAVAGSVLLGRRALPTVARVGLVAAGVLLVLVAAGAALDLRGDVRDGLSAAAWTPGPPVPDETYPLLSRYGPVTDVLPYAADGTPLDGVLLYDQDGRPLHVGFQEWWADQCVRQLDQPLAADGVPVPNSFPQGYELLGLDVDIHGVPVVPGQCVAERERPEVPLPVFPAVQAAG